MVWLRSRNNVAGSRTKIINCPSMQYYISSDLLDADIVPSIAQTEAITFSTCKSFSQSPIETTGYDSCHATSVSNLPNNLLVSTSVAISNNYRPAPGHRRRYGETVVRWRGFTTVGTTTYICFANFGSLCCAQTTRPMMPCRPFHRPMRLRTLPIDPWLRVRVVISF